MRTTLRLLACTILFAGAGFAAPKQPVVAFGKWSSIKLPIEDEAVGSLDLKTRSLYVDGRVKETTFGAAHDVTDRAFVVQRLFRLNDSLTQDEGLTRWRRGGWLLVDRVTGKVQQITLPQCDPESSAANWFAITRLIVGCLTTAKSVCNDPATGPAKATTEEGAG